jgi:S1-C subfamily serine protease
MNKRVTLAFIILMLAVSMMSCQMTSIFPTATVPTVAPLPVSSSTNQTGQQNQLTAIYQQFSPGVVSIRTTTAEGSGWVYSGDGYIVTNNHVVDTEKKVEVDFPSGLKTYGTVVGTDAYSDLAVIKVTVPASELHPLPMGDSDTLQVGQNVIAIGNPFGLNGSMSTGIISALGRALPTANQASGGGYFSNPDIIQTDAALNPGNSGGPLLNLSGEVIGINSNIETTTFTTSGQPANSGVGFAISINMVKRVVPSLIQRGKFDYPYLGISSLDDLAMSLDVINALGLTKTYGVYITGVISGGPAEKAGIQAGTTPVNLPGYTSLNKGGDLIIAVDSKPVLIYDDLIRHITLYKSPGDTVTLTVLRGDQQLDLPLVLGTRP